MTGTEYHIDLLALGRGDVPGPELFWMSGWETWYPLTFQAALIRGNGIIALVNTGPAEDIGPMNDKWEQVLGKRARMERADDEFIVDQLAKHDVRPQDVTHVLLTPFQLYTISNVALFTNAQICVSSKGWTHFHTTHDHPHDDRSTSIPDEILVHLVTEAWPRMRLLGDSAELAPGLRTWWCGVHHRASMVVEVDTPAGTAAISDSYFYLDNVLSNHPIGINENMYEALDTYARVRRDAQLIIPLYDPKNFERFPEGRVA